MAREHGRDGRQRVERAFSLSRMVERYNRLYTELLGFDPAGSGEARASSREPAQG
jgi:hypothetical protein